MLELRVRWDSDLAHIRVLLRGIKFFVLMPLEVILTGNLKQLLSEAKDQRVAYAC